MEVIANIQCLIITRETKMQSNNANIYVSICGKCVQERTESLSLKKAA